MRYITNDTASPIYVAGRMIPPYDGRHFEDHELGLAKPEAPAPAAEPSLDEQLQELRKGPLKELLPHLAGLTFEAIERLAEIEATAETPRKTLLQAIDAEKLRRADQQLQEEEAGKAAAALEAARAELLSAKVAQLNLPPDTTEAEREAAEAAVQEAQAKVDALTPKTE